MTDRLPDEPVDKMVKKSDVSMERHHMKSTKCGVTATKCVEVLEFPNLVHAWCIRMHVFHWMDLCVGFSDWSGLSSPHNKLRLTGDQLEATCHREQLALQRFAAFTQSLTKPQARNKFQANTESLKVATTAHGTGSKQHFDMVDHSKLCLWNPIPPSKVLQAAAPAFWVVLVGLGWASVSTLESQVVDDPLSVARRPERLQFPRRAFTIELVQTRLGQTHTRAQTQICTVTYKKLQGEVIVLPFGTRFFDWFSVCLLILLWS